MRPFLISPPLIEPVSLDEAKAWLRQDASDEDDLIQALIVSARITLETYTRRFFVTQIWRLAYDAWPLRRIDQGGATMALPFAPLQNVAAIRVYDAAGAATTLAPTTYVAPAAGARARLAFLATPPDPGRAVDGIEIDLVLGYGSLASDTPAPLRSAMLMLIAQWREHRGDDAGAASLPAGVCALASSFRRERLT